MLFSSCLNLSSIRNGHLVNFSRPRLSHSSIENDIYTALFTIILAENININSNIQNKDINKLINIVQLRICYMFVKVLTKDITQDALGKFPHKFRTPFQ